MITIQEKETQLLTATNRLICLGALRRGWIVSTPYITSPHFFINRGDGKSLHIFSATPPTVSYASAHLVNDKYTTSVVLADAGIAQLPTIQCRAESSDIDVAKKFLKTYGTVVVKPIDGGHGRGITTNVTEDNQIEDAVAYALEHTKSLSRAVLQKQMIADNLHDIRIAIIDRVAVAAVERIPARVRGDGKHTIEQLIAIENQGVGRGEPYRARLSYIDAKRAAVFLGRSIHHIPEKGEYYTVLGIANYGAGGELLDVTDDVPTWMVEEAILAADALGLSVAGVDYLSSQPLSRNLSREDAEATITEVNKCPALALHDEPTKGVNRHTVDAYLNFIARL